MGGGGGGGGGRGAFAPIAPPPAYAPILVLRHHHISASLYGFFCTRPVREGVSILATLTLNYGIKIRSNQKNCHSSLDALNI